MRAKQFSVLPTAESRAKIWRWWNAVKHPLPLVAWAAVHSRAVVLLLLVSCFVCFPLFAGVLCLSLFCYELVCDRSSFAIILKRKK